MIILIIYIIALSSQVENRVVTVPKDQKYVHREYNNYFLAKPLFLFPFKIYSNQLFTKYL